jgi:hypothetical protein
MTLIEIKTDLSRVAKALERIADSIERISPPPSDEPIELTTNEDLYNISDNVINVPDEIWKDYGPRRNY